MREERLVKLARVLVDYSVEAGEGEQVVVSGGVAAEPLIKEVYARLLDAGAIPIPQISLPGMQELFFGHAREVHYEKTPPVVCSIYEGADAFISIMAPQNTRALAAVDPRKQQALSKRDKALQEIVRTQPQMIFLDIELGGGDGFDLLAALDKPPVVVFVT